MSLYSDEVPSEDITALHLSQAANYAYNFAFSEAHTEAKKCMTNQRLSIRQECLLWDHIFCVGRIFRGEGHFQEAKRCFETCLQSIGISEAKHLLAKSAVADVYCGLAYLEATTSYLHQAELMLELEITRLRQLSRQHLKGFRRLLASLTEVRIRQGRHNEANLLSTELIAIYHSLTEPDIVDRLGHVRMLIAMARISSFISRGCRNPMGKCLELESIL